jgi:hypothetical protein
MPALVSHRKLLSVWGGDGCVVPAEPILKNRFIRDSCSGPMPPMDQHRFDLQSFRLATG